MLEFGAVSAGQCDQGAWLSEWPIEQLRNGVKQVNVQERLQSTLTGSQHCDCAGGRGSHEVEKIGGPQDGRCLISFCRAQNLMPVRRKVHA
jgi:hypothetical protein